MFHSQLYLKLLIIVLVLVTVYLNLQVKSVGEKHGYRSQTEFQCYVEDWNKVETNSVPFEDLHWKWVKENVSRRDNILGSEVRLLTAFVNNDYIAVTTTSQHSYGESTYCRYFDCNRKELPSSAYKSIFFPMNVVKCPRRIGAKYMSISSNLTTTPKDTIPLIFRAYPKPLHEVSVCVGALYGEEKKWLEVVEFVEHYKLLGVRHFYFTIYNMNEYSRKVMDEYLRTGEIELTVIQSEYKNIDWQFHLLQINECHERSKHHSRWVINVDIDERMIVTNRTIPEMIRKYNESVSEIGFAIQRIMKTERLPERYINDTQLTQDMMFLKYNWSAAVTWGAYKSMYRPEKVAAMYFHWAYVRYPDSVVEYVNETIALIRHYRTTKNSGIGKNWQKDYGTFSEVPTEVNLAQQLKQNVLEKVKFVYDQRALNCSEIPRANYDEYKAYGQDIFHCTGPFNLQ